MSRRQLTNDRAPHLQVRCGRDRCDLPPARAASGARRRAELIEFRLHLHRRRFSGPNLRGRRRVNDYSAAVIKLDLAELGRGRARGICEGSQWRRLRCP